MFTGIVAAEGRIVAAAPRGDGVRLTVNAAGLSLDDVVVGDSIAVSGCCLTVVAREKSAHELCFDVSAETLRCTTGLEEGAAVNLEKALRLADRLGGHLVTGHVDGVGTVQSFAAVGDEGDVSSFRLVVVAPGALARFIAPKGSIAIAGVSLTVNAVEGAAFEVNLIPHTLQATTLRHLVPGARVNLEVDLVARYVERLVTTEPQG